VETGTSINDSRRVGASVIRLVTALGFSVTDESVSVAEKVKSFTNKDISVMRGVF
jgi:hypothetical protein